MKKILIISGNRTKKLTAEVYDSLILKTILENGGFNADYVDYSNFPKLGYYDFIYEFTQYILCGNYDIVIFQSHWHTFLSNIRLASEIKAVNSSVKTLFLGSQATNSGEAIIKCFPVIDYVYIGEPENSICKIIEIISNTRQDDLTFLKYLTKKPQSGVNANENITDVNSLPHLGINCLKASNYNNLMSMPINVGRGCPYGCTFCNICLAKKRLYRLSDINNIINDIKYYQSNGIDNFSFEHDSFFVNREKILLLCKEIKKENLKFTWSVAGRIDNLDFDIIDEMYDCGLRAVSFGIETGSERMQKLLRKKLNLNEAFKTIQYMRAKNIKCKAYFMYGFPNETENDLQLTMNYAGMLIDMGVKVSFSLCCFSTNSVIHNEYYNELFYNPKNYDTLKNVFGYEYEEAMIRESKEIFSYLYDYSSLIREKYKFLSVYFAVMQKYKLSFRYINNFLYNNTLAFYEAFINSNIEIFSIESVKGISEATKKHSELFGNLFLYIKANFDFNFEMIEEIYRFETDLLTVEKEKTPFFSQTYKFNYKQLSAYNFDNLKTETPSTLIICCKNNHIYVQEL